MGLSHSPRIVTDGLVLCLDAANKRSYPGAGTTWTDLKGSNHGTLTNGPTFSSDNGGGIVFDGTDEYVDCGNGADLNFDSGQSFSLSIWYRCTNTRGALITKGYETTSQATPWYMLWANNDDGDISIYLRTSSNQSYTTNENNNTANDQWFNIVGTFDAGNSISYTYTNGVRGSARSSIAADSYGTNARNFIIGKHSTSSIIGRVSSVHVYNKALTADEVRQNYLATKGRYA